MDYRFNNGRGAVLCRKCRIIIDEDLSYVEAVERWKGRDLCKVHKVGDITKEVGERINTDTLMDKCKHFKHL